MKRNGYWLLTLYLAITVFCGLCQNAWALNLDEGLAHKRAGDQYLKQNHTIDAIREYKKAIEFNPKSTTAYFNLAIAYFLEKNLPEAISALEVLTQLDPKDVEARYNLASLKLYEGKWEEAVLDFEQAQSCSPPASSFAPLIDQALEYIKELSALNSASRALALFALQSEQNLTPGTITI